MIYASNPISSVPRLMQVLQEYGEISGYKINDSKSEAMMLSGLWPSQLNDQVRFHWSREGFRYLGIVITSSITTLYEANYGKLLKKIKADMHRWDILPLSLIGRVEVVRMNILPQLLFLFQSLPVGVPGAAFKALDKELTRFVWQNKRPKSQT